MNDHSEFRVHVVLRGSAKQMCISPGAYPKPEAEQVLAEIDKARREKTAVSLFWLSVDGADVLAAHLEEATSGSAQRPLEEVLADLKAKGIGLVMGPEDDQPPDAQHTQ
ncbi:MAG TPA: hypothetical protein VIS95_08880 [Solirubrobacterales bacterium]